MNRFLDQTLSELSEALADTHNALVAPLAGEADSGAIREIAGMSALLFAGIKATSKSHEEFKDEFIQSMAFIKGGFGRLPAIFEQIDEESVRKELDQAVAHILNFGIFSGIVFQRVFSLADERRSDAADAALRKASDAKRATADPVREAARAAMNPNMTQSQCARLVAHATGKNQRSVERIIAPMFEWRELKGGAREKRPKSEFLTANGSGNPAIGRASRG